MINHISRARPVALAGARAGVLLLEGANRALAAGDLRGVSRAVVACAVGRQGWPRCQGLT